MHDRKSKKDTEVQYKEEKQVSVMWKTEGIFETILTL